MEAAIARTAEQEDPAPEDAAGGAKRQRLDAPSGMLSTLGMSQEEYGASLAECMRERLLQLIPKLPPNKLGQLLDTSFEHIQTPGFEPIVTALLQHTTELPPAVISALADPERQLLPLVPMQCRHRVWTEKPDLFIQETHGHILDYTEQAKAHRPDLLGLDSQKTRQHRCESSGVQELLRLIGSRRLYAALIDLLRDIYKGTDDGLIAALRCDMAMALHDLQDEARPAGKWDPVHKAIWCLDACQREGRVEPRMLKELSTRLAAAGVPAYSAAAAEAPAPAGAGEAGAAGAAGALPELAFALCAPPHRQLLARGALERLDEVARTEQLPHCDPVLPALMTLLVVGSYAGVLLQGTPVPPEAWPVAVGALLHRVLPLICTMIVEDRIAQHAGGSQPGPLPSLPKLLKAHVLVAPRLVLLYALRQLRDGDEARLCQLLPLLAPLGDQLEAQSDFVAALVDLLVAQPARLTPRLCEAVLHVLLLPLAQKLPAFHLELLRLLEEAREPLQRLKAGPSKGSVLAGVLLAARESGLDETSDEALLQQRWQALHMGVHF